MKIHGEIASINQHQLPRSGNEVRNQTDFSDLLKSALSSVNDHIWQADEAAVMLASGQMEIHDALIIAEKANLALQLTMAIRNKIIEAYQEIMRMQV
ncbi:MAG: flagellar hook-basal body complex protein FliE [Candidatus Wallacebacter cryptica]|jgi:flagellar hook-basal body complex protein FliE|nr:flagellar hook-basal body complex protein FliE [Bacillota bacterium]